MALQHDAASGFLRGESIADDIDKLAQELKLLRAIEANTSDMAKRLGQLSVSRPATQSDTTVSRRPPVVTAGAANDPSSSSRARGDTKRSRPVAAPGAAGAEQSSPARRQTARNRPASAPGQAGPRDASGRFVRQGQQASDAHGPGEGASTARAIGGAMADVVRDLKGALSADVDSVDPSIQAGKELGSILSPALSLFKPFGRLFGRSQEAKQAKQHRESVTWWRRIWRTQADANKGAGRRGVLGLLGMLLPLLAGLLAPFKALGRLLGVGGLLKAASSLLPGRRSRGWSGDVDGGRRNRSGRTKGRGFFGRVKNFGSAALEKGGGLLKGGNLLKFGKGALRKLPIIGSLLGMGMIASDAMAGDDPSLSKEENKKRKWGNVGGGVGSLVGGALGALGGPVGIVVGGIVGDIVGGLVGEWLSTVDFDAVLKTVSTTFNSLATAATDMAGSAFKYVQDSWGGLISAGTKAFTSMVDWAKDAWASAKNKVLDVKDTVADKASTAKEYVGDKASKVADSGANLLYKATGGKFGSGGSAAAREQMIQAMDAGGITDPRSKAMLMANVDHESGGFTRKEENLNYSAKRLMQVFPKYYKNVDDARADAGNPEAIANRVYGGRMGNTEAGDGYKYRGRGALQLTGKAQYEAMGKKIGVDLVNNPELAADPKYSAQIAVAHWKASGADKAAQAGDLNKARRLTNGGLNGLDDVKSKYESTYLAMAKAGELTPTRRADQMKVAAPEGVSTAVASTMSNMTKPKAGTAVTPIGVLAPTKPRAEVVSAATPAIPATIAAASMRSYAPAAADAGRTKVPATPDVKTPAMGGSGAGSQSLTVEMPLSQDVSDRGIAHAASGGLGQLYRR